MTDHPKFEEVCSELFDPNLEGGWEFFVESHGVTIHRLYNEVSGLYQYKIYGSLKNVPPEVSAQVYMDLSYRKTWDSYAKELYIVKDGDREGVYWQINFPFMMSNRDYVYNREYKELEYKGHKVWIVFAQSEVFDQEPERKGVIRVTDYTQKCVLMTDGQGGTKAYMHYYDDPKGMIPTWIINWGAKTGVPAFLTDMEKACKGYLSYLETQNTGLEST